MEEKFTAPGYIYIYVLYWDQAEEMVVKWRKLL